ncbi:MAG: HIT domain-containing protein [Planctomycetes bacterium]|nr:HIT domain-containing protein [Planctomycetota bacterium]
MSVPCVFCTSDGGEVLWRDELCRIVLAREEHHPLLLRVIHARHVREMSDLPVGERTRLMERVFAAELVLRELLDPEKLNLASLGNVVPHVHWHVVPRWKDDAHFPSPIWSAPQRPSRSLVVDEPLRARLRERLATLLSSA